MDNKNIDIKQIKEEYDFLNEIIQFLEETYIDEKFLKDEKYYKKLLDCTWNRKLKLIENFIGYVLFPGGK